MNHVMNAGADDAPVRGFPAFLSSSSLLSFLSSSRFLHDLNLAEEKCICSIDFALFQLRVKFYCVLDCEMAAFFFISLSASVSLSL